MVVLRLTLRGLWARRGVSVAVLLVAAVAAATAVAGPVYLHAGGDSITSATLAGAQPIGSEISVAAPATSLRGDDPVQALVAQVEKIVPVRDRHLFAAPVLGLQAKVDLPGQNQSSMLAWRTDVCAHLQLTSGSCPSRPGEVLVSGDLAGKQHWHPGSQFSVAGQRLRVIGIYLPQATTDRYWGLYGDNYFPSLAPLAPSGGPTDDALFTVRRTLLTGTLAANARGGAALADLPLRIGEVRRADVPALQQDVPTIVGQLQRVSGIGASTAIPTVLGQAEGSYAAMRLPVLLVVAQLLLLCWLVLFFVVAGAVDARGGEIALAKVRGLPPLRTLTFGLAETLLLVALAVPVGLGAGYAGTLLLVHLALWPGTPTVLTWLGVAAAAVAAAGAMVAAVVAAWRTMTRPVLEQWRRAGRLGRARAWVFDAVVLALAVAGLVELLNSGVGAGGTDPVALLAPGLLVLAVALIGSRLVPVTGRAGFVLTRHRGTAAYLAFRQLARRPGGARLVLVLAVAFGLAAFAVSAVTVAAANTRTVAGAQVGAGGVLTVVPPPGTDLQALVHRADPTATVVEGYYDLSGGHTQTLGVDPAAFAAVAAWPAGTRRTPAQLHRALHPAAPDPIVLAGTRVRVALTVDRLTTSAPVALQADVQPARGGAFAPVTLGRLPTQGEVQLVGDLPACGSGGCVLRDLHVVSAGAQTTPVAGTLVFRGVGQLVYGSWQQVPAGFGAAGHWQSADHGTYTPPDLLRVAGGTLVFTVNAPQDVVPGIDAVDTPVPLPALVTSGVAARASGGTVDVTGLDGKTLTVHPVGVAPVLPGYLGPSVIIDRTYALRAGEGLAATGQLQVWVAPGHVTSTVAALHRAGVTVSDVATSAAVVKTLSQQGPLLALVLFLAGAAAAALLTAGGVAVNLWLTGRRRGYEIAALRAVGLRTRTLYAALLIEQMTLVLVAALLGVGAGIAAAYLALPNVPEFTTSPPAALLHYHPPTLTLALLVAGTLALLGVAVAAVSVGVLRGARPVLLREAQA